MSTKVTKFGTIAENLDVGLYNAVTWFDVNNALTSNNQNAFSSFSIGYTFTQYLYIHDFGFNIPTGAIIESININVKKRAAGPVSDLGVYLVYNPTGSATEFSPANMFKEDPWTSAYQTITYGGTPDEWVIDWDTSDFNSSYFGVALAAMGDGSVNNGPVIDYFEINISYHQEFTHAPTGKIICYGSVSPTGSQSGVPSGGINCAGHGLINYDEKGAGGAVSNSTAEVTSGIFMTGGIGAGSSAIVQCVYKANYPHDNFYSFYCFGKNDVPPNLAHEDKMAIVWFSMNPTTRRATWHIDHNMSNIDALQYMGPAKEGETGTVHYSLHLYYSMTSPIFATVTITPEEVVAIQQGLGYLFFKDDASGTTLRGQMRNTPLLGSGSATVECRYNHSVQGSTSGSSSSSTQANYRIITSGGVFADGTAKEYVYFNVGGGISLNSGANNVLLLYPQGEASGAIIQGIDTTYVLRNMSVASSGVIADGLADRVITFPISVGTSILIGGSGQDEKIVPVYPSGGIYANGEHSLQQFYSSIQTIGGIKIFGAWAPEKLKYYTKAKHVNYALLMKSENKINKVQSSGNRIMDPFQPTTPVAADNPFSDSHQPGWCDFWDVCDSAYLPKVVQSRQKEYLPAKQGKTVQTNRAIAQMD